MSQCKEDKPTSIFGLSMAQLHPLVEKAVGEAVVCFDISFEHQIEGDYGFAAEKLIPTFSYVTAAGRRDRVTVFVKYSHNPKSPEPEHYRFLAQHGVPLPKLYGVMRSPEGRPMLFIEYVDTKDVTRPPVSPEVQLEFLALVARFNAIQPSPEYAVWLEQAYRQEREGGGRLRDTVEQAWELGGHGKLGVPMQQYCTEELEKRTRLCALADQVEAQVTGMELGLVSEDFSFENSGRRANGERVMLDVEGIGLGARFMDVALLVGVPEDQWCPAPYPSREALAEHYLCEYARWGGVAPPLDRFLAETRLLRLNYQIGSTGFGVYLSQPDSPFSAELREEARNGLPQHLEMLARYA